ncbi:hypothetical protein MKW94_016825 [Papaver nudicaule]|uniref:Prephenate dehydratase domain-containing protein n=1 Tax=Papaver nudicaule TaxID=74823 RepID=A0AA41SN11_PAPNU|nr:hypothetical protein [Papaver nudicaule]
MATTTTTVYRPSLCEKPISKISRFNQITRRRIFMNSYFYSLKKCKLVPVRASIQDDNYGNKKKAQALELQRIFEDSQSLPNWFCWDFVLQGVPGAYSELAAAKAWIVDRAVLPIENSLGGSIHRNYDLLLRHNLHIVGEVRLSIRRCLLANYGVEIGDLRRVLSHPQALAQCENTLTKLGVAREAVDDTAGANFDIVLLLLINFRDEGQSLVKALQNIGIVFSLEDGVCCIDLSMLNIMGKSYPQLGFYFFFIDLTYVNVHFKFVATMGYLSNSYTLLLQFFIWILNAYHKLTVIKL